MKKQEQEKEKKTEGKKKEIKKKDKINSGKKTSDKFDSTEEHERKRNMRVALTAAAVAFLLTYVAFKDIDVKNDKDADAKMREIIKAGKKEAKKTKSHDKKTTPKS